MKAIFAFTILMISLFDTSPQHSFKQKQLGFKGVKAAYDLKWNSLKIELQKQGYKDNFELLINAYKAEGKLEVWLKPPSEEKFSLFKVYNFAGKSGTLGPKVIEGDLQTPEGFYYINVFNPMSTYHLSLGINYPNAVDKVRTGKNRKTGGEIYIHGNCVTVGCIPLTDDKIKEVYVLAVEARNAGQKEIPVNIYPFKMTDINLTRYTNQFPQHRAFWKSLQLDYLRFEAYQTLPKVELKDGRLR